MLFFSIFTILFIDHHRNLKHIFVSFPNSCQNFIRIIKNHEINIILVNNNYSKFLGYKIVQVNQYNLLGYLHKVNLYQK